MVTSALLVAVPVGTQAANDKWTTELYAWDPVQNGWVNGNLAGYHEGDLIGFKFVVTHDTGTNDASPELDSVYDHFDKQRGAYGIDSEVLWGFNTEGWVVQFPTQSEGVNTTFNVIDPITPSLSNAYFGMNGQTIQKYYKFNAGYFNVSAGSSIYIYFQAHVAETAYYSQAPTTPGQGVPEGYYKGASFFPGASMQVALSLVFTGTSSQTQSIPVTAAAGSISGMKFHDANANHTKDAGEGGLSNWTIKLDGVSSGGFPIHLQTVTGSDGSYRFAQVPWGTYTISESLVGKDGWTQTFPLTYTWSVIVNGTNLTHTGLNFGNVMPGEIKARKIIDTDGDLTTTADRYPGVGWTFELFFWNGTWSSLGTKVTGSDGYTEYWENLVLGNYKMVEVSAPTAGYTAAEPKEISLTTADQEVTMTFYNYPLGNITVYKYNDLNGDGNWDEGEPALSGVTINLYEGAISEGEDPIDTDVTDSSGKVCFEDLYLGSYTVEEILSEGWTSTNGATQAVVLDSPGEWVNVTFLNFENVDIKVNKHDGNGA
ncbi:MAG TPA: SdrD B-like domain-containing protein, partial [Methanomassiliicoccales archaeon]|nr:SdrD B-like domain-containing protein [Methanomassiliicoccales archaeon]